MKMLLTYKYKELLIDFSFAVTGVIVPVRVPSI